MKNENVLPQLSGKEFAFIRRESGFTQKNIMSILDFKSVSSIYLLEKKDNVNMHYILFLKKLVGNDIWNSCMDMLGKK